MLVLLRQGKISKWFSGIGQEAIAVSRHDGFTARRMDHAAASLNLGVFTTRNMPLSKLFMQWQGNKNGYSNGRERSFHFRFKGSTISVAPSIASWSSTGHYRWRCTRAYKLRKRKKRYPLAFTGDGGTSEGDFHEALNTGSRVGDVSRDLYHRK